MNKEKIDICIAMYVHIHTLYMYIYIYNGMLFILKKEGNSVICHNMYGPCGRYAK